MTKPERYDAIVIGTGQGGGPLAGRMADAGWKVAVIEREQVGGTCINRGCTPTKTMIASARVAYLARRGADYGVKTGAISIDLAVVRKRKRDIVEMFSGGSRKALERKESLDLIMGEGSFASAEEVKVDLNVGGGGERLLAAEVIIINTGLRPRVPPLEGIDSVNYLDSTSIMELDSVPEHLIVVGGGYVGLEFGQMFRRFGSDVTVVENGPSLCGREDPDVCDELSKILAEDGIEVHTSSESTRVEEKDGSIRLTFTKSGEERTLKGSHMLVAAGRSPNSERLNLQAAGVETDDHGFISVNDRLETGVNGIYAIGDVIGRPFFTHISYDHYRVLRANLLEGGDASKAGRMVPYTVFTDPQLGRVGVNEKEARAAGLEYKVAKMPMSRVARALEVDEARGFMKALIDPDTKQILGCTILGLEGGEIMSMLQIAMMGEIPYPVLQDAIFAHPTLAESLNNLFGKIIE